MEQTTSFKSGDLLLEGLLEENATDHGLIVTHPHPLYGGDMHNLVVDVTRQVFAQNDFTTLRFNFRGAGNSQGNHDNGRSEQADVLAAVSFLESRGIRSIVLAGYSFGAWVNALASDRCPEGIQQLMISPPVAFIDFKDVQAIADLKLIITGESDEIAPAAQVQQLAPHWNQEARLEIVKGADHFYSTAYKDLATILDGYASKIVR